jgi:hypothetical protein
MKKNCTFGLGAGALERSINHPEINFGKPIQTIYIRNHPKRLAHSEGIEKRMDPCIFFPDLLHEGNACQLIQISLGLIPALL